MVHHVSNQIQIDQVIAPPSKSYAQRIFLAAGLSSEPTIIEAIGENEDINHLIQIGRDLGVECHKKGNGSLEVIPSNFPAAAELNIGESGLGIRLLVNVLACIGGDFRIEGKGSLTSRSMIEFEGIMNQLQVNFQSENGFIPLQIKGKAKGGEILFDGQKSSQYLSGLLMGLPLLNEDSVIEVSNLKSRPYVDITLDVLNQFGIQIRHDNYQTFYIKGGQVYQSPKRIKVEGDYSGMANFVVLGAIQNGISIQGLSPQSVQGDKAILDALHLAGGKYEWEGETLHILPTTLTYFEFDANDCPDLFPPLVIMAAAAKGTSIIKGCKRLVHKESNRATVIQSEAAKMALKVELQEDEMFIFGKAKLKSTTIDSHNDHRIAMMGAIAATLTESGIEVNESEAVRKSFPNFWELF